VTKPIDHLLMDLKEENAKLKEEIALLRAKAALADAMWHRLDTINRPLDEYEGQWYVEYDEKVKP